MEVMERVPHIIEGAIVFDRTLLGSTGRLNVSFSLQISVCHFPSREGPPFLYQSVQPLPLLQLPILTPFDPSETHSNLLKDLDDFFLAKPQFGEQADGSFVGEAYSGDEVARRNVEVFPSVIQTDGGARWVDVRCQDEVGSGWTAHRRERISFESPFPRNSGSRRAHS